MNDTESAPLLETDLWVHFNIRLSDLFKDKPEHTLRQVLTYLSCLPADSLLMKLNRNDPLTTDQHLLLNIIDILNHVSFDSKVAAMGLTGKEYRSVAKKAPKPVERPKIKQPVKEVKFVKVKDLKKLIEGKKRIVHHTPECVASEINKGGGKILCGC